MSHLIPRTNLLADLYTRVHAKSSRSQIPHPKTLVCARNSTYTPIRAHPEDSSMAALTLKQLVQYIQCGVALQTSIPSIAIALGRVGQKARQIELNSSFIPVVQTIQDIRNHDTRQRAALVRENALLVVWSDDERELLMHFESLRSSLDALAHEGHPSRNSKRSSPISLSITPAVDHHTNLDSWFEPLLTGSSMRPDEALDPLDELPLNTTQVVISEPEECRPGHVYTGSFHASHTAYTRTPGCLASMHDDSPMLSDKPKLWGYLSSPSTLGSDISPAPSCSSLSSSMDSTSPQPSLLVSPLPYDFDWSPEVFAEHFGTTGAMDDLQFEKRLFEFTSKSSYDETICPEIEALFLSSPDVTQPATADRNSIPSHPPSTALSSHSLPASPMATHTSIESTSTLSCPLLLLPIPLPSSEPLQVSPVVSLSDVSPLPLNLSELPPSTLGQETSLEKSRPKISRSKAVRSKASQDTSQGTFSSSGPKVPTTRQRQPKSTASQTPPRSASRVVGQKAKRELLDDDDDLGSIYEDEDDDDDDDDYQGPSRSRSRKPVPRRRTASVGAKAGATASASGEQPRARPPRPSPKASGSKPKKRRKKASTRPRHLCPYCQDSFTRSTDVTRHVSSGACKMNTDGVLWWPCLCCDSEFGREDACLRHRKVCWKKHGRESEAAS